MPNSRRYPCLARFLFSGAAPLPAVAAITPWGALLVALRGGLLRLPALPGRLFLLPLLRGMIFALSTAISAVAAIATLIALKPASLLVGGFRRRVLRGSPGFSRRSGGCIFASLAVLLSAGAALAIFFTAAGRGFLLECFVLLGRLDLFAGEFATAHIRYIHQHGFAQREYVDNLAFALGGYHSLIALG